MLLILIGDPPPLPPPPTALSLQSKRLSRVPHEAAPPQGAFLLSSDSSLTRRGSRCAWEAFSSFYPSHHETEVRLSVHPALPLLRLPLVHLPSVRPSPQERLGRSPMPQVLVVLSRYVQARACCSRAQGTARACCLPRSRCPRRDHRSVAPILDRSAAPSPPSAAALTPRSPPGAIHKPQPTASLLSQCAGPIDSDRPSLECCQKRGERKKRSAK